MSISRSDILWKINGWRVWQRVFSATDMRHNQNVGVTAPYGASSL